jgi:ubiquinone/menaquinone biosynthesis C-methylase UbiE
MVRRLRAAIPGADQTRGRTQIADARRVPPRSVVHEMGAETLPFADASIDTVLATLTLCTVDDLEVSAQEIRRVLRPGGSLLVLEHVRSLDLRTAVWQERWKKPWRWAGGGCNLDRETGEALAEAGFETSDLRRVTLPGLPLVGEVLTGRLIAP